ncbi:MAG: tetratricopeptide repeat protein [Phycisphaerales bacterium]
MSRVAQLEKMLAAEPNDPFALYGLAQEHAKAGALARAVESYDRCLAADPSYHYAYFHKARAQEAMGRADDAIGTLKTGIGRARAANDAKALSELTSYLDELTP